MGLNKYSLGELIEQRRKKYDGISDLPIRGVSRYGFIDAKQPEADTSLYNTFYKFDFVFNPARMEINSIALNVDFEKAICSSLYEVFYVKRTDIVLPEYLNLFIKRDEFARLCEFIGWGSAREYCRVGNISDIEIELPSLSIQKKYVDVYNSMLENQKAYETGLEDLKLTCDAYIEELRRNMSCKKIEQYIKLSDVRNGNLKLNVASIRGISIEKKYIPTKADMKGVSLKAYAVVAADEFAYVTVTSRNGEKISIAHNDTNQPIICSSSYVVFGITNKEELLPEYLMMWFKRSEFDRYTRFHSWGSARETFTWNDIVEVEIPIPDIVIQQDIVNIYHAYILRKGTNDKLKEQIKDLCPILIKGSLEEARG